MARYSSNSIAATGRIDVFGDTVEAIALAQVLSTLCGQANAHDLSECVALIAQSMKAGGSDLGKSQIIILYNSQWLSRSARLLDVFYELRFSLGWLGPVAIVARPEAIKEVESADLFRMSRTDQGPVPQKCIPSPLCLASLLGALANLDGYGRFAWRQIQQGIHDKDLIRQAHQLAERLTADMNAGRDFTPAMRELRDLLRAGSGALLKFMQYHVDLGMVDRALSGPGRRRSSCEIRQGAEELLRATDRLPQL